MIANLNVIIIVPTNIFEINVTGSIFCIRICYACTQVFTVIQKGQPGRF